MTDEYIRLMRECWTREPVDFTGHYYTLGRVSALPKPAQKGGIPVWIGGHTDAALRRAGRARRRLASHRPAAAGLLHPEEFREKVAVIHDWARKAGRDPSAITLSLRVPLEIRPRGAPSPRAAIAPSSGAPPPRSSRTCAPTRRSASPTSSSTRPLPTSRAPSP